MAAGFWASMPALTVRSTLPKCWLRSIVRLPLAVAPVLAGCHGTSPQNRRPKTSDTVEDLFADVMALTDGEWIALFT